MQFTSLDKDRVSGSSWILNLPDYGTKPSPRMSHSMVYYENTIILYGGVSENNQLEDDKFYQYKLDYKMWSVLNITGVKPGFRSNHSMCFLKQKTLIIFGGKASNDKNGEFSISNDIFLIDLKENNSMTVFIAGLGPSQRFGHGAISNFSINNNDKNVEMVITGGLDSVFCPMEVYLLKEIELTPDNNWVYEQKKHSNEQLQEKDHIFETAKNAILLYKKQLEVLELKNIEINKKHSELYNILSNYKKKELEENVSTNMKKNELKEKKQQIEAEQRTLALEHNELREYNNLYNQYLEILRSRCMIVYEYLTDALEYIKEMDEMVNEMDKSEYKMLLFSNVDMDSLIFKRKNFKNELDSFKNFFKDVSYLENELYEDIQRFEKEIKEKYSKFYYLKTDDMKGIDLKSPNRILEINN